MPDNIDYRNFSNLGINPQVLSYLTNLSAQQQNISSPIYQAALSQSVRPDTTPSMIAALGKSFSQLGTLNGRSSDTSALSDYAKALQQAQGINNQNTMNQQAMAQQGVQQQVGNLDKFAGMQAQQQAEQTKQAATQNLAQQEMKSHEQIAKNQAEMMADRFGATQQNQVNKRLTQFQKDMNEGLASSRTGMGKSKATIDNADKILQIQDQANSQPGGLDSRQMHEVAISTANLLSQGSGAAQATIDSLVPHTIGNDVAKLEEWLTSEPQGVNQQAFIQRMFDTANREKFVANEKVKEIKSQVLPGYADLKQSAPAQYAAIVNQNFSPDEQMSMNKGGGRYAIQSFKMPQQPQQLDSSGGTAYAGTDNQKKSVPPPPQIGTVKSKNGTNYKWDGQLWQPLTGGGQ